MEFYKLVLDSTFQNCAISFLKSIKVAGNPALPGKVLDSIVKNPVADDREFAKRIGQIREQFAYQGWKDGFAVTLEDDRYSFYWTAKTGIQDNGGGTRIVLEWDSGHWTLDVIAKNQDRVNSRVIAALEQRRTTGTVRHYRPTAA